MQVLQTLGLLSRYSLRLDSFTLVCLLQGCINQGAFVEGKVIHTYLVKTGAQHNVFVWTALADMYANYGNMEEAWKVFDAMPEHSLVTWNVLIGGYVKHGLIDRAFKLFKQMLSDGMHPDVASVINMVHACVTIRDVEGGRLLHFYVVLHSLDSDNLLCNAMIDMYGKCGSIRDSHYLFERMQRKDSVSWAAFISGYALMGFDEQSLKYFYTMIQQKVMPNNSSFLCILNVCARLGILDQGRLIHSVLSETTMDLTVDLANAIVDMYGKCGCVADALQVFKSSQERDCVSWNTIVAGLAQSGSASHMLGLVLEMEEHGAEMSYITFLEMLYACSHAGLLDIGIFVLIKMGREHGVVVGQDHHAALIDLLGRAGKLDVAFFAVHSLPFQPSLATWRSLLSACRLHNDLRKARKAAEFLVGLEPLCDAAYLLLYNASAADRHALMCEE